MPEISPSRQAEITAIADLFLFSRNPFFAPHKACLLLDFLRQEAALRPRSVFDPHAQESEIEMGSWVFSYAGAPRTGFRVSGWRFQPVLPPNQSNMFEISFQNFNGHFRPLALTGKRMEVIALLPRLFFDYQTVFGHKRPAPTL